MTKYTVMDTTNKTKGKKTIFRKIVGPDGVVGTKSTPEDYDNVTFLWRDDDYGDVFVAWEDDDESDRVIFFGEKGDEFDDKN